MSQRYEKPTFEVFDLGQDIITSSSEPHLEGSKNPGHHYNCIVMPNGKPIPENAEGYWSNHQP